MTAVAEPQVKAREHTLTRADRAQPESNADPCRPGTDRADLAGPDRGPARDLVPAPKRHPGDRLVGELPAVPVHPGQLRGGPDLAGHARGVLQHVPDRRPFDADPVDAGLDGGLRLLLAPLPVPRRALPARRRAADDPGAGGVHPAAQAVRPDRLLNSFGAIWLVHTAFALPFGIFLLRNFFITCPRT